MLKKSNFLSRFDLNHTTYSYFQIGKLSSTAGRTGNLPYSIRILAENVLRNLDHKIVGEDVLNALIQWPAKNQTQVIIPFFPARIMMQDFTGVPAIVDFAAMREELKDRGMDPARINPRIPVDLIVDHSIQVDHFGSPNALEKNVKMEYQRNRERYILLKWAQKNFSRFNVVPPNSGICHQVNLEYLGRVVVQNKTNRKQVVFPDTLLGTDSHTTMINGIGILGWGVGGIEAEAVALGQPYFLPLPEVIGVRLSGRLRQGTTATDLVLTLTERLRKYRVVEKFVEYFGPGMKNLSVAERATIANMSPEYGATVGFFPVDERTIEYLKKTGRPREARLAEKYCRKNDLFYNEDSIPVYTDTLELDLGEVEPSIAGPFRPQDRLSLTASKVRFRAILDESGQKIPRQKKIVLNGEKPVMGDGSVVIAALTSCTNTSNPLVMLGTALMAKRAVEKGLKVPPFTKTSLAPGSKVVVDYLKQAGLLRYLEKLGFFLSAFGCTTCIGNSGPLHPEIERIIKKERLLVAAVLSGNRNFEARIHPLVRMNFLASPMLVLAFALAGTINIDFSTDPLGADLRGNPVFLRDIWPEEKEIDHLIRKTVKTDFFKTQYSAIFKGDDHWTQLPEPEGKTFSWDKNSTYIKMPPFFKNVSLEKKDPENIINARVLLYLGDSITTDHISPAGAIPGNVPAGRYLIKKGTSVDQFNSYGSRRGNHEVMTRGTFANIRIKNKLVQPREGGYTLKYPEAEEMHVFEAAEKYARENIPLIVLAGKEYGTGSSRDWAAKGCALLGIRAIIAESFERIHRSNLLGMGILPLVFSPGQNSEILGLDGSEAFTITGIRKIKPRQAITVRAVQNRRTKAEFKVIARLDNEIEVEYYRSKGILQYALKEILMGSRT